MYEVVAISSMTLASYLFCSYVISYLIFMGNEPVLYYIESSPLLLIVKHFMIATFKPMKVNKISNVETKLYGPYHRVEKSSVVQN